MWMNVTPYLKVISHETGLDTSAVMVSSIFFNVKQAVPQKYRTHLITPCPRSFE